MKWVCTVCAWEGEHKDTVPVMYHGRDWQNCPSCQITAIPKMHENDILNYHDVVRIVEEQRPYNPKMVVIHDEQIIEKAINKIRNGLRKLKKGE